MLGKYLLDRRQPCVQMLHHPQRCTFLLHPPRSSFLKLHFPEPFLTDQLCLGCRLLLPYGQLLGQLWHSTTWPSGQLVVVDAEPPRLVARSLYYKSLNGGPCCHDVFTIELPADTPVSTALYHACRVMALCM